jgi:uncharacterized protein YecT (DUF1311 family)
MRRSALRLACLSLACLCLPAAAQGVDCENPQMQMEMNQCAYEDWESADAELNLAYDRAMQLVEEWDSYVAVGKSGAAEALRDAQRAWITFRDKACESEAYAMKGGTGEAQVRYTCLAQLTEDRTTHLIRLSADYGN